MSFADAYRSDKELKALREEYEKKYDKCPPPLCLDEGGIDVYKQQLREMIAGTYVYKKTRKQLSIEQLRKAGRIK